MKTIFLWLIRLIFIVVITALVVVGRFSAQSDISKWADIFINLIITIIGAFLGFFSALWLDKYNETKKNIETKKKYKQSLSLDINKIKIDLNSIIQKEATDTITFQSLQGRYFYFELPIWEAMVSTGKVNLFNDEAFFDDICKLSAIIKTLNNIENNVMIARLVSTQTNIDKMREQKLREIYDICEKIDVVLTNKQ